jgi:hypothetical protein
MEPTKITKSTSFPASPEPIATGDMAAEAFARFDRAVPPDEVVAELLLPVGTVEYLWRTWARLRGVVPLSPEAGRTLREALYSNRPIADGAHAVAAVRRFLERPIKPCLRCKDGAREYCTTCPSKEATRAARGTLRGSSKKPRSQHNRSGLSGEVESTPTRKGDAFSDATAHDAPRGSAEAAGPEPGKEPP